MLPDSKGENDYFDIFYPHISSGWSRWSDFSVINYLFNLNIVCLKTFRCVGRRIWFGFWLYDSDSLSLKWRSSTRKNTVSVLRWVLHATIKNNDFCATIYCLILKNYTSCLNVIETLMGICTNLIWLQILTPVYTFISVFHTTICHCSWLVRF